MRYLLLCLLAAGSAAAAAEQVIYRGVGGDPDSLDPHRATGNTGQLVLMDLFEGLYTLDAKGRVVLGAAQSVAVSEDGLRHTFTLRPDLAWSDGRPLTADDFVYSFRRLHDRTLVSARGALGLDILANAGPVFTGEAPPEALGVSAPSSDTVVLDLARPLPYLPSVLSMTVFLPVPRHTIEAHAAAWVRPGNHVSNGAFRLREFVLKQHTLVERNPHFHSVDQVALDRLYYQTVEEPATGLRQFLNGELDVMLGIPRTRLAWIKENIPNALRLNALAGVYFYLFNVTRPPFDNPSVRRALSLALDRDLITSRILVNGEQPAYRLVPPAHARPPFASFEPTIPREKRLAEAERLLAKAGYSEEQPLRFEVKFDGSGDNKNIAVAMGQMWKELPVQVTLTSIELGALMSAARRKDYDLLRWVGFAAYDDPTSYLELLRSDSPSNRNGFSSALFDADVDRANQMLDLERRAALLENAERTVLEQHPILPIYFMVGVRLVNPAIKGWKDHPGAFNLARYMSVSR